MRGQRVDDGRHDEEDDQADGAAMAAEGLDHDGHKATPMPGNETSARAVKWSLRRTDAMTILCP
jgi:hypothetical protein